MPITPSSPTHRDRAKHRACRLAALALAFAPCAASAMPLPVPSMSAQHPDIVEAYAGCGPYGHRGPAGYCRPGGQRGGYVPGYSCPRGFHVGPYGRRCRPD